MRPGGQVIMSAFSLEGPTRCSGLDVVRYSPETLQRELGDALELVDSASESHCTPSGMTQAFTYCRFQLKAQH